MYLAGATLFLHSITDYSLLLPVKFHRMNTKRYSGILLHPTSLPGRYGIGTLGVEARKWIDFLEQSEQKWWQILPLGHTGYGDSPYQCFSSRAGNPLLIDFDELAAEGLLDKRDFERYRETEESARVDFYKVMEFKYPILTLAYQRLLQQGDEIARTEFETFNKTHASWLDDYALYLELKRHHQGKPWNLWEESYRSRNTEALHAFEEINREEINFHRFCQWVFYKQWHAIKQYANAKQIEIIGDIPLYVAYDSADVWAGPGLFLLDDKLNPTVVAGVPPDYFSATGQLWGNPIYDWKKMQGDGFKWWIERVEASLELYDWIRIDHFRGFCDYWGVPFGEPTATNGQWYPVSGQELFEALWTYFGPLKVIAEDLGAITPEVLQLRDNFGLPGMKILQYAFFGPGNDDLPHNYIRNCTVYTGTHDNETTVGWYKNLDPESKNRLHTYLQSDGKDIHWKLIRLAWASVANFAIVPMQDILGLDNTARMNTPGTIGSSNWQWRLQTSQVDDELVRVLKFLTVLFERNRNKA